VTAEKEGGRELNISMMKIRSKGTSSNSKHLFSKSEIEGIEKLNI
jgi:hypothetical protein